MADVNQVQSSTSPVHTYFIFMRFFVAKKSKIQEQSEQNVVSVRLRLTSQLPGLGTASMAFIFTANSTQSSWLLPWYVTWLALFIHWFVSFLRDNIMRIWYLLWVCLHKNIFFIHYEPMTKSINQSINQSLNESTNGQINQSINQSITEWIYKWTNQSIDRMIAG